MNLNPVRASNEYSSADRMKNALAGINKKVKFENLKIYNYSLFEEDFSISKKEIEVIFSEKVDYFHFAASLKYNTKRQT